MKSVYCIVVLGLLAAPGYAQNDVARKHAEQPGEVLARVERAAEAKKIEERFGSEGNKGYLIIPVFEVKGDENTFLPRAVRKINARIRWYNWRWPRKRVPYVRTAPEITPGAPEYQPALKTKPGADAIHLTRIPIMDAARMTANVCGLKMDIEPEAIWLHPEQPYSLKWTVKTERTYAVPRSLGGVLLRQWIKGWHGKPEENQDYVTRKFDEKNRTVTLGGWDGDIDDFEIWYAGELVKAGYKPDEGNKHK